MKLDFIYLPSKDVASDLRYFIDVLLLTDHLEDDRPVLIYRVDDPTRPLLLVHRAGRSAHRSL